MVRTAASLLCAGILCLPSSVISASLDKIQYVKISPYDPRAVIRGGDGMMLVVRPGDAIADNATVKEIVPDRIIVEEQTANGLEIVIVRENNGAVLIERKEQMSESVPQVAAEKEGPLDDH